MSGLTLSLSGAVYLFAAVAFGIAALTVARRAPAERDPRAAAFGFVVWWGMLGAYMVVRALLAFYAASGGFDIRIFLASRFLTIPLLTAATWGLTHHLLYLFTGRAWWRTVVGGFYAFVTVVFFYSVVTQDVTGARVGTWLPEVVYDPPQSGGLYTAVLLAVGLPPIIGSTAYLTLLPQLTDRAQRYRVGLVSPAILLWVGSGLAARLGGGELASFLTLTVLGIMAALLVLAAYRPPARVADWLERPRRGKRQGPGWTADPRMRMAPRWAHRRMPQRL